MGAWHGMAWHDMTCLLLELAVLLAAHAEALAREAHDEPAEHEEEQDELERADHCAQRRNATLESGSRMRLRAACIYIYIYIVYTVRTYVYCTMNELQFESGTTRLRVRCTVHANARN